MLVRFRATNEVKPCDALRRVIASAPCATQELSIAAQLSLQTAFIPVRTMNVKDIRSLISVLGFVSKPKAENVFVERYSNHGRYSLTVDFENKRLSYGAEIKVGHQRVLGFDDAENFVV